MSLKKASVSQDGKRIPVEHGHIDEIWIQKKHALNRVYIRIGYYRDYASFIAGDDAIETRDVNVPLSPPDIPDVPEGQDKESVPPIVDPFEDMRDQINEIVNAFIGKSYLLAKKVPDWVDAEDV